MRGRGRQLLEGLRSVPLGRAAVYLVLVLFAVAFLTPIWVALTTSLKRVEEVETSNPLSPPADPTLDAYAEAIGKLGRPLLNSVAFTAGAVGCSLVLGSVLGYIFSKIRFRYSNLLFMVLVAGTFLPYTTIVFPLFRTMSDVGLAATIPGMIFVHTVYGIPICTLLFRNFYAQIPQRVIDGAKKRGAGEWEIYRRIVLPASGPAIVAVVVYQFTSIWNDFLFGLVLGGAEAQAMPVTVALFGLKSGFFRWNLLMAGAMIVVLPLILVYVLLQKYFVWGVRGGAEE